VLLFNVEKRKYLLRPSPATPPPKARAERGAQPLAFRSLARGLLSSGVVVALSIRIQLTKSTPAVTLGGYGYLRQRPPLVVDTGAADWEVGPRIGPAGVHVISCS
jgi:hypothetical protein